VAILKRFQTKKISEFYGDPANKLAVSEGLIRLEDNEPRGSNGFAISGSLTKSGDAMLLYKPAHIFLFRGEVHMVSEEGLNAYGAVTWGQFFVYQGFNEKTGWMHTSTGTDIIDQFEETIVKEEGKIAYKSGDTLIPIDSLEVTLNYKSLDGVKRQNIHDVSHTSWTNYTWHG